LIGKKMEIVVKTNLDKTMMNLEEFEVVVVNTEVE
jgi:hypothetical protein